MYKKRIVRVVGVENWLSFVVLLREFLLKLGKKVVDVVEKWVKRWENLVSFKDDMVVFYVCCCYSYFNNSNNDNC